MKSTNVTSDVHAADAGTPRMSEMPVQSQSCDARGRRAAARGAGDAAGPRQLALVADEQAAGRGIRDGEQDAIDGRPEVRGVAGRRDADAEHRRVDDTEQLEHLELVPRPRVLGRLGRGHRADRDDAVEEAEAADDDRVAREAVEDGEQLREGRVRVPRRRAEIIADVRRVVERVAEGPRVVVRMRAEAVEDEHAQELPDAEDRQHVAEHAPLRRLVDAEPLVGLRSQPEELVLETEVETARVVVARVAVERIRQQQVAARRGLGHCVARRRRLGTRARGLQPHSLKVGLNNPQ